MDSEYKPNALVFHRHKGKGFPEWPALVRHLGSMLEACFLVLLTCQSVLLCRVIEVQSYLAKHCSSDQARQNISRTA